jgi:hypothetical protein
MSKFNVTLDVALTEDHYEIEAKSEDEAIEKAIQQSSYKRSKLSVFEVEKLDV